MIAITITILVIIYRRIFYLKYDVSFYLKCDVLDTRFCPYLQVEPSQLSPVDRASL
jgi:hypothetical protein